MALYDLNIDWFSELNPCKLLWFNSPNYSVIAEQPYSDMLLQRVDLSGIRVYAIAETLKPITPVVLTQPWLYSYVRDGSTLGGNGRWTAGFEGHV